MFWIGLAVSYFVLRASELSAKSKEVYRRVYCLKRGDVAFFRDNDQLAKHKHTRSKQS